MQERIVEAVGDLLHTGYAEVLSRTSRRASVPFPMSLRRGIGWDACWVDSIFNMWSDKKCVQRERWFQVKRHPPGFIGSADDIIISTEPGFEDNSQVFSGGDI